MNPWGLTNREEDTLCHIIKTGTSKLAAREMGISFRTVEIYLSRARKKMGTNHTLVAAIEWDRYVLARTAKHDETEYSR